MLSVTTLSLSLPPKCYHLPSTVFIPSIIFLPPEPNAPCPRIVSLSPYPISLLNDCVFSDLPLIRTFCTVRRFFQNKVQVIACFRSFKGSLKPLQWRNNPHLGTQALHDLTIPHFLCLLICACAFSDSSIMEPNHFPEHSTTLCPSPPPSHLSQRHMTIICNLASWCIITIIALLPLGKNKKFM